MSDTSDFPTYEEQLEAERIKEEERTEEHELHQEMRESGPRITSSSPASLVPATVNDIEVMGSGFVDGSEIEIDGQIQSTTFVDDTHLSAVGYTAPDISGTVTITVRNPDTEESNDFFVMVEEPQGMAVTSVTPDMPVTNVKTSFTITGSGFTGVTAVDLIRESNSTAYPCTDVIVVNDTTITCMGKVPAGGTNRYHVKVTKGTEIAQLDSAIGSISQTVTSVTPNPIVGADPQTGMTAVGTLFQQAGVNGVKLGSEKVVCTNVVVVSDTSLTFDFPGGIAPSGNVGLYLDTATGDELFPGSGSPSLVST